MGYYGAIIGGVMDTIGTALVASQADKRKRAIKDIANTPGLDFGALTKDALSGYEGVFDRAAALSRRTGLSNQEALNAMEESALPGLGAARGEALGAIRGLFADDADWLKGVQRRGAALGLSSGLFGSQAGQLQTLRLGDQEKMQRTQLGTGLLGSLIGSMRIANTPGTQTFLGPSISEQIGQRANERTQRMSYLAQAAGLPSGTETWGMRLQQAGSALAGASLGGGGGFAGSTNFAGGSVQGVGGGWGGGGGGISASQQFNMMQDTNGMSNMGLNY